MLSLMLRCNHLARSQSITAPGALSLTMRNVPCVALFLLEFLPVVPFSSEASSIVAHIKIEERMRHLQKKRELLTGTAQGSAPPNTDHQTQHQRQQLKQTLCFSAAQVNKQHTAFT
jgi:hypothetical protein